MRLVILSCLSIGFGATTGAQAVPPTIHAVWDDLGDAPELGVDYLVLDPSSDFPSVVLISEQDTWRIWSTDPNNPGGIGDIGVISISSQAQGTLFQLGISSDANHIGPGARHVQGIVLDHPTPQGETVLEGGRITGNLTGPLFVERSNQGLGGYVGEPNGPGFTIDGNATGAMTIPEMLKLIIGGQLMGDIVSDRISGTITVGGRAYGDIIVTRPLPSGGKIAINGLCLGSISIGQQTSASSEIELLAGLGASGRIEINVSRGHYNAGGLIEVGKSPLVTTPLPPVVYDGCIRVYDDGAGHGGDLSGAITVYGCHATADDLNICIDGDVTGSVSIVQPGCSNQAGWSCGGCGQQ